MFLKAIIIIFSCLLSLALASKEAQTNQNVSANLKVSHEIRLLNSTKETISDGFWDCNFEMHSRLIASLAKRATSKVTIEDSNLSVLEQVAAADCLKLAYEYHESDADRIELFIALFTDVIPSHQWNAVLAYQHLYFIANYYIRLRTNNGDALFVFSSNN